jgi:hypothetical protein
MDSKMVFIGGLLCGGLFLAVLFAPELGDKAAKAGIEATRAPTDAETALQRGELSKKEARAVNELKRVGIHVTLADLKAAQNDGPGGGAEALLAEIDTPSYEALNPLDQDRQPHRALCFTRQSTTGVVHDIVYYNDGYFYDMGEMGLSNWIRSGCAQAIRTRASTTSLYVYYQRLLRLVPRDELHKWRRDSVVMELFKACTDDAEKRRKGDMNAVAACRRGSIG